VAVAHRRLQAAVIDQQLQLLAYPATRGQHKYRTYKPTDSDHVAGASRTVSLKVT